MTSFDPNAVKAEYNQYWYSQLTIDTIVSEVVHHATRCAFLSTPSLFFALDQRKGNESDEEDARLCELRRQSRLFEYDRQWEKDGSYVFYDFHHPEKIPVQHLGAFDYIVADPPFITADVWEAYIATAKLLLAEGGKILFTTVLENHTMLEGLINGPLFIPLFRPCVCHLTYQYVCFLNYDATRMNVVNPEIEAEDPKIRAGIEMANDIRHSEKAFAIQMNTRDRDGEVLLPTTAHQRDLKKTKDEIEREEADRVNRTNVPLTEMEWNYIPEGLSMYANGSDAPPSEGSPVEDPSLYGEAYLLAMKLRAELDRFKCGIDRIQKIMDGQMRLRHQRVKLRKDLAAANGQPEELATKLTAELEQCSAEIDESERTRAEHLHMMSELVTTSAEMEQHFAELRPKQAGVVAYAPSMLECIEAYKVVEAKKNPLQELAADATRKYKSPIFSRMKEILQEMKEIKKENPPSPVS